MSAPIYLTSSAGPVAFAPIKALLEVLRFTPQNAPELLAYRIIDPNDVNVESARQVASLTDAADYDEQIRFFLKARVIRTFRNLAKGLEPVLAGRQVVVGNCADLDGASALFLETLAAVCRVDVCLTSDERPDAHRHVPSEREQRIAAVTAQTALDDADADFLRAEAKRHINVGDAWTASSLLWRAIEHRPTPELWSMLGLCHTLLDRTIEAEHFYRRWRGSGNAGDLARANYAIAMLYARHHPAPLRDLETAGDLLQEGYEALSTLTEKELPNIDFESVFNRNGYALIEFRRGHTDEAMSLLRTGIDSLEGRRSGIYLHKTVLIYNLAQCYKQLRNLDAAIETYRELLAVDGQMPEYHLELARILLDRGDSAEAIAELRTAYGLDPAIAEASSLLGFAYMTAGDLDSAVEWYERAYSLARDLPDVAYDYAFALHERQRDSDAKAVLANVATDALSDEQRDDLIALQAEVLFDLGQGDAALEVLLLEQARRPASERLAENIELARSILVGAP